MDIHDDFVYAPDGARDDVSVNEQERRFGDIELRQAPETTEDCNASSGGSTDSVRPRSPRPVRKRVRPKCYDDQG